MRPPLPRELPRPTYSPALVGAGMTLIAWGAVSSLVLTGLGLVVLALGLAGWFREIRIEHRPKR